MVPCLSTERRRTQQCQAKRCRKWMESHVSVPFRYLTFLLLLIEEIDYPLFSNESLSDNKTLSLHCVNNPASTMLCTTYAPVVFLILRLLYFLDGTTALSATNKMVEKTPRQNHYVKVQPTRYTINDGKWIVYWYS